MTQPTDAEIISQYIAVRDHIATLKEKHAAELAPFNQGLETMEGVMAQRLIERGAQNVKTEAGTVYRTTIMKPKVADRDAFLGYAIECRDWSMLSIGVLLDPLKEFMEKNDKRLPPGVDVTTLIHTNFRKA